MISATDYPAGEPNLGAMLGLSLFKIDHPDNNRGPMVRGHIKDPSGDGLDRGPIDWGQVVINKVGRLSPASRDTRARSGSGRLLPPDLC
jgi:hypothetical protein